MIQIEPIEINGNSVVLIHYKPEYISAEGLLDIMVKLSQTGAKIVPIENGKPLNKKIISENNVFIANEDNKALVSAITKICKEPQEKGKVVYLTKEEFRAMKSTDLMWF